MHPNMDGRRVPYLVANDKLTKTLKNNPSPKKQLRCGVAWKSKNQYLWDDKSILLSDLNEIFQIDGYEFVNLQYGDTREEIKDLENNYGAKLSSIDGIDLFENIDGLLSIIQTCDLIVTTSNVTAHLAGALGKTTFLLVPYATGRIWYWHEEAISSWYPSIYLFTQSKNFEWISAIKDITAILKK
jgi:ADP-heptose:LPS heptosyltransferase